LLLSWFIDSNRILSFLSRLESSLSFSNEVVEKLKKEGANLHESSNNSLKHQEGELSRLLQENQSLSEQMNLATEKISKNEQLVIFS